MKALTSFLALVVLAAFLVKCSKDGSSSEATFDGTGLSGSTAKFTISGNTLYTVDNQSLHIFDISQGNTPNKTGNFEIGRNVETIFSLGNRLFIGSQGMVYLVDISNPLSPSMLGSVSHFTSCDPVVSDGQYAYSTIRSGTGCRFGINSLDILNIDDERNPFILKSYMMQNPKGLAVNGNWLFVCDNGIKMYDKTDYNSLILKDNKIGVPANDVIADNDILIVTADDGIYQYGFGTGTLQLISKISKVAI